MPNETNGVQYEFSDVARHTIVRALDMFLKTADFTKFEERAAHGVISLLDDRGGS